MKPVSEIVHTALPLAERRGQRLQKFTRSIPSISLNIWIRDFKKWISVIEKWKLEAGLIDRLVTLSTFGEERKGKQLHDLQISLSAFVQKDVKELEKSILDMEQNLELLRRCMISSEEKVKECKIKMQQFSKVYSDIKNSILKELALVYPVSFQ